MLAGTGRRLSAPKAAGTAKQRDHPAPCAQGSPAVRDSDKLRSNTATPSAVMPRMVVSWGIRARQETQSLLERMGHPLADRMWSPGCR